MSESLKPLVDRIVSQPLQFKKATKEDSSNVMAEGSSYIMISSGAQKAQQELDDEHKSMVSGTANDASKASTSAGSQTKARKEASKPASFAEALKMYTSKKSAMTSTSTAKQVGLASTSSASSAGKSMTLGDELLLSDDEYRGSSTDDEEHPMSLLDSHATPDSNDAASHSSTYSPGDASSDSSSEDASASNSASNSATASASVSASVSSTSSSDEDEDEVFHEASEFIQTPLQDTSILQNASVHQDGDEDDSDDGSFHGNSDSSTQNSSDEGEGNLSISEDEKEALKLESLEHQGSSCNNKLPSEKAEEQEEDEDDDEEEEEELKHKSPIPPSPTPPTTLMDKSSFYQFNENANDHGCNKPQRIIKNWGPKLTQLKPRGLLNHGVTCYTNAAVQTMVHIPAIQHYLFQLLRGDYKNTVKAGSVSHVLAETTMKMWAPEATKNTYINPDKLINSLEDINCMMSVWNQEDSHEYFMSLMSRLQEDSVPKGHKMTESIIYDVFGGLLQQSVKCSNCGEVSTTEQPIYDLSLHLKGRKTNGEDNTGLNQNNSQDNSNDQQQSSKRRFSIEKSIRDFFNPELIKRVDNKEGYTCEKCKMVTNALKSNKIIRAPETLVVHLKKFRFNGTSSSKMKQAVSYPMFLDLTEYCHESISSLPVRYQLISVVVHEGRSLSSGHYIAHCKQPDGSWATYDDEYINKITEKQLLKEPNAYYLVYTRLTPKSIQLSNITSSKKSVDFDTPRLHKESSSNQGSKRKNKNQRKNKNKNKSKKRRISQ